jgi:hypothetical protein
MGSLLIFNFEQQIANRVTLDLQILNPITEVIIHFLILSNYELYIQECPCMN